MSATSADMAPSGECLRSKGRYGSCGWQVKLCDALAIGPYLSTLEMRFMTKRYTNGRSLPYFTVADLVVCSRDGKLLIGGGRSRFLHVWSLDTQTLLRVIELPRKVTSVQLLEFLPSSFDAGSNKVCHICTSQ